MKLGPIDGSTKEVQDLLENNGLRLADYLQKPPVPLKTLYLVVPSAIFAVGLIASVVIGAFLGELHKAVITLINLVTLGGGVWLTVCIQLRFHSALATLATAVGALVMLLVAAEVFTLRDAAEFVRGLIGH